MKRIYRLLLILIIFVVASCSKNKKSQTTAIYKEASNLTCSNLLSIADSLQKEHLFSKSNKVLLTAIGKVDSVTSERLLIDINNKLAYNYRRMGIYDSALSACYNSIAMANSKTNFENLSLAKTYYLLGLLYRESNPDSSYKYLTEALQIRKKFLGNDNPLVGDVYNNLGVVFLNMGNYSKALFYYKKALALREKRGSKHPSVGSTYMNIANLYQEMGKFKASLALFDTALTIQKSKNIPNNPRVAAIYSNMASSYNDLGMIDKSIELYNKALAIFKSYYGNKHLYVATVYNNLAVLSMKWGDYKEAAEYLSESIKIKKENESMFKNELLDNYINLGEAYINLGNNDSAIEVLRKGLKICNDLNNQAPYTTTMVLFLLADVYLNEHQPKQAVMYAERGLRIITENYPRNSFKVARVNYKTANVYEKTGNYLQALKHVNKALKFFYENKNEYLSWVIPSEILKAEIYLKQKKYFAVKKLAESISNEFMSSEGNLDYMKVQKLGLSNYFITLKKISVENYFELYRITSNKALLVKAISGIKESEKLFENIRSTINNEKSKIILSGKMKNLFNLGIEILSVLYNQNPQNKYFETALNFAENSKSLSLLENISEKEIVRFAKIPDSILIKRKRLQSLINSKERELEKAELSREELINIRAAVFSLKQNLAKLNKNIEENYKDYSDLIYKRKRLTLDLISDEILEGNQTIIEFSVTDTLLFSFVISGKECKLIRKPIAENLSEMVNNLTESIKQNDKSRYTDYAYRLYKNLIEPCEPYIKTERVIIIDDGVLEYVPYDALISSAVSEKTSYKDYPYLINKYSFGYAFSIGILEKSKSANNFVESFIGIAPFTGSKD